MKLLPPQRTALILIDFQKGFDNIAYWGEERNNLDAEEKARSVLQIWRRLRRPVYHVKHNSLIPASLLHKQNDGAEFKAIVAPILGEPVFIKRVNSAFIGTGLKRRLKHDRVSGLVIAGLTTDHCVSTTARMAANFGFRTSVVADATATFSRRNVDGKLFSAQLMHETALASLHGEFATIVSCEEMVAEYADNRS